MMKDIRLWSISLNEYANEGYTVVDCGDFFQIQKNKTVVSMVLVPMQLGQPYGGRIYPYKKVRG